MEWQQHEIKASQEFADLFGVTYECLVQVFCRAGRAVATLVEEWIKHAGVAGSLTPNPRGLIRGISIYMIPLRSVIRCARSSLGGGYA